MKTICDLFHIYADIHFELTQFNGCISRIYCFQNKQMWKLQDRSHNENIAKEKKLKRSQKPFALLSQDIKSKK